MDRPLSLACLVAPCLGGTLLLAAIVVGELSGATPFSEGGPRNGAEAAALGDAAALVRFVRSGENPRQAHPVRPHIISGAVQRASTLEAAAWSRRIELIWLLDREGVIADAEARRELACLATDLELSEMAAYLVADGLTCHEGEARQRVLDRTK